MRRSPQTAAIPILQQMVSEMPGHSNALGYCAAALVHAGRMDDAKAMV
ncbi:MAG: tetratricopeptide repeat protein, partial [Silicimonas sp.]|nr:tetratricopeptide repeat protein [Silicimonas sp.]